MEFKMKQTALFLVLICTLVAFACSDRRDRGADTTTRGTQIKGAVDMDAISSPSNPKVVVKTNKGSFYVELFQKEAPLSVRNFLAYVDANFYDGTIFHRVISNFMIQGGGSTPDMAQQPTVAPIRNEADNGLRNVRGTLAMARTQEVHSATSQFFVNVTDNAFLDHGGPDFGYAVFGKVTEGMDVVDVIRNARTGNVGGHSDVPTPPVVIESIRRVE